MIDEIYNNVAFTVESLTIIISLLGAAISLQHSFYFKRVKNKLSLRMRDNFFWDACVYAVTFFMGVGLLLDLKSLVQVDIIIRPLVLFFAVIASFRLYKHYKRMHNSDDS